MYFLQAIVEALLEFATKVQGRMDYAADCGHIYTLMGLMPAVLYSGLLGRLRVDPRKVAEFDGRTGDLGCGERVGDGEVGGQPARVRAAHSAHSLRSYANAGGGRMFDEGGRATRAAGAFDKFILSRGDIRGHAQGRFDILDVDGRCAALAQWYVAIAPPTGRVSLAKQH